MIVTLVYAINIAVHKVFLNIIKYLFENPKPTKYTNAKRLFKVYFLEAVYGKKISVLEYLVKIPK